MGNFLYKDLTYQIIGVLFDVHNELGGGFLEVVYLDAVEFELKDRGIPYEREKNIRFIKRTPFCLIIFTQTL